MKQDKQERNEPKKSRIVIEFNNPEARNIIRSCALIVDGQTLKGKMAQLIARWLREDCNKTEQEITNILGY